MGIRAEGAHGVRAGEAGRDALADDPHLRNGLNIAFGKVTCEPVAQALGYAYVPATAVLS